jgi:phosphatidylinositol alpha-mannosyltransferase
MDSRRVIPARRAGGVAVLLALVAGLLAFALTQTHLHRVAHALLTASPGWVLLAVGLMAISLVMRSVSWRFVLQAALADTHIPWMAVARASMIGVLVSALLPGRAGEPARVIVLTRRLQGSNRRLLAVLAGTVFSQTLINLAALAVLAAVTLSAVPLLQGRGGAFVAVLVVPFAICLVILVGPGVASLARRSRHRRLARGAERLSALLALARTGLSVFTRPRHGTAAVGFQMLAWALQWLACYVLLLSLGLQHQTDLSTAAAILLAVNLSAVLPATPSNVGVFQAACLVVLAAYGVGAGPALAYGIILQAVEVLTALGLGVPALLGEGVSFGEIRRAASAAGTADPELRADP